MVSSVYVKAGERIEQLRKTKGYTRDFLANKTNISTKFLYEIETGKKGFTAEVLYRLSDALEVKCDYILVGKSGEEPCNLYVNRILNKYNDYQKQNILRILELICEIS